MREIVQLLAWLAFLNILPVAQCWPVVPAFVAGAVHGRRPERSLTAWWPWFVAQAGITVLTIAVLASNRVAWLGHVPPHPNFFSQAPPVWSLIALVALVEASVAGATSWAWLLGRVAGSARRRGAWVDAAVVAAVTALTVVGGRWLVGQVVPRWVAAQAASGHMLPLDLPVSVWMACAVIAGGVATAAAWRTTTSARLTLVVGLATAGALVGISGIYDYTWAAGVLTVAVTHYEPYALLSLGPLLVPWGIAFEWIGIGLAGLAAAVAVSPLTVPPAYGLRVGAGEERPSVGTP